jgi:HAD superfamily hydrolase (TIGR01509 family)
MSAAAADTRRKVEGVLLDVDGTLIDSNDAHARSWSEALKEFGRDVPPEKIRPLIGKGGDKLLPELLGTDADSDTGRAFSARRAEIFRGTYIPHLRPTPGATELIQRFRKEELKLVIATSAAKEELDAMLRHVGLDDLVEKRTSSDDADHSKPDPDIIQAALKKGSLHSSGAILIGDTPYDVEAASRAGVDTVAFLCGGWTAGALEGAIAIYEDPADLLRRFTSSPFSCAALSPDRSGMKR